MNRQQKEITNELHQAFAKFNKLPQSNHQLPIQQPILPAFDDSMSLCSADERNSFARAGLCPSSASDSPVYGYVPGEDAPPGYPQPDNDKQPNNDEQPNNEPQLPKTIERFYPSYSQYLQNIQMLKFRTQELKNNYPDQLTEVHRRYLSRLERLIQKTVDILIQDDPDDEYESRRPSTNNRSNRSNQSLNNSRSNNIRSNDSTPKPSPKVPSRSTRSNTRSNRANFKQKPNPDPQQQLVRSKSDASIPRTIKPRLPPEPPIRLRSNSHPNPDPYLEFQKSSPREIKHPLSKSERIPRTPSPISESEESSEEKVYQLKYYPESNCYQAETVRTFEVHQLSKSAPTSSPIHRLKENTDTRTDIKQALFELTELNRKQSQAIQQILLSPRSQKRTQVQFKQRV